MGFHNQSANSADKIVNKLYDKISADTTAPATYYEKSEVAASSNNQHKEKCVKLMDYLHTHPDAVIRFHASDTILYI